MYDSIIVGGGPAGAVVANRLANAGKKVLVLEKRRHVAGNCYDEYDENGIMIHVYGPHIFHTNNKEVYEFLSEYTKWYEYSHEVLANIHGEFVPVPFNLNTIANVYEDEKAERLTKKLIEAYGLGTKVPILELRKSEDEEIRSIADYVYENVFLYYTMKQWGQKPEDIDPQVTGRVPVSVSYDNRYFTDEYQGMPLDGYTKMFERMLDNPNIKVELNTDCKKVLSFEDDKIMYNGEAFNGDVVFTGQIDELFDYCYGRLPYRTLEFVFEHYNQETYQPVGVVNYTTTEDYTRITEFKYLTNQKADGTTIVKEYSHAYDGKEGQIPYYSIINDANLKLYNQYADKASKYANLKLVGRLAEYKYYNIDAIVAKALSVSDEILGRM